ncbi:hypothetical protein [Gaetbulibacter sp. NE]|uniref:hypothetical protein n=1 Tax=Gaetbulibacter sp. NE TaxID=2982307 RepID=UPI0021CF5D9A|nr:hypothetical protein [Gaetbulibacter sp. NE]
MQFKNYIISKLPFFVALSFAFVLASCGSYQYVGYDNDGIYNSDGVVYEEDTYQETTSASGSYYKNYFAEKSQQYESIPEENIIFTDIESYEGNYTEEEDTTDEYNGYAGWGQDSDNITINVYSNYGWNNWGYYNYWGWNRPFYSWNRWNTWGWNSWGWNNWAWNSGWGYYGYNSFWGNPYYNGFYYGGYYNRPYYYNGYRNGYAYNRVNSRRGQINNAYNSRRSNSVINNSRIGRTNRSTLTRPRSTTTRTRVNSSTTRRNSSITPNRTRVNTRSNNSVRPRSNSTRTRVNSSSTRTRVNTPSRSSSVRSSSGSPSRSSGSRGSSGRRR